MAFLWPNLPQIPLGSDERSDRQSKAQRPDPWRTSPGQLHAHHQHGHAEGWRCGHLHEEIVLSLWFQWILQSAIGETLEAHGDYRLPRSTARDRLVIPGHYRRRIRAAAGPSGHVQIAAPLRVRLEPPLLPPIQLGPTGAVGPNGCRPLVDGGV